MCKKILIVEGKSDKKRVLTVLAEPVEVICTNGTVSPYRIEELLMPYENDDLYVFLDADASGEKIRKYFIRDYPEAVHLYTDRTFKQVETTPYRTLAAILLSANFQIRPEFLL